MSISLCCSPLVLCILSPVVPPARGSRLIAIKSSSSSSSGTFVTIYFELGEGFSRVIKPIKTPLRIQVNEPAERHAAIIASAGLGPLAIIEWTFKTLGEVPHCSTVNDVYAVAVCNIKDLE